MPPPDLSHGPPTIPLALVEYLEAAYPDRFPTVEGHDPHAIAAGMHRAAGRIDVVRFLRSHLQRQTQPVPTTPK